MATSPHEGALWEDALYQVDTGRLDGPLPSDAEGKLMAGPGPHLVHPAFRFGARQGSKWRAVGEIEGSQTYGAAVFRTPVNLPTWGHFAAILRMFHEAGIPGSFAMAQADHKEAGWLWQWLNSCRFATNAKSCQ